MCVCAHAHVHNQPLHRISNSSLRWRAFCLKRRKTMHCKCYIWITSIIPASMGRTYWHVNVLWPLQRHQLEYLSMVSIRVMLVPVSQWTDSFCLPCCIAVLSECSLKTAWFNKSLLENMIINMAQQFSGLNIPCLCSNSFLCLMLI